jgi:hypothetical protein
MSEHRHFAPGGHLSCKPTDVPDEFDVTCADCGSHLGLYEIPSTDIDKWLEAGRASDH